jgi:predicted ribosome quality control (RQC) complex YloA/Tae2 family protein
MIRRGKSAAMNWQLYRESAPEDTLFHLDELSSPYVIIEKSMKDLTPEEITMCARQCWEYSAHTHLRRVRVMYTPISNTRLGKEKGSFFILNLSDVHYVSRP